MYLITKQNLMNSLNLLPAPKYMLLNYKEYFPPKWYILQTVALAV